MNTSSHSSNGGHVTAAASGSSKWTAVTFRNLAPRSDVCVVTLPLEASASSAGREDDDNDNADRAIGNDEPAPTKRILHFVIGGETTTETGEADIVESIEWQCQRCWRMAALNRPRIGCGAALLRGVIYTVGGLSNDSTVLSSVEKYSFFKEEKRWELLSDKSKMKAARWGHAVVALPRKNAIFAIGGRNSSWQELSSVEVAQQSPTGELQWNRLPYGMRQKRFGAAAVPLGDASFLVMGGFDGSKWTCTTVLYEVDGDDIRDGMWTEMPDMPQAVVFGKAVVATMKDEKLVIVAGATGDGSSALQVFVVKQGIWTVLDTDGGEGGCSLAVEGDNLLCIGGGTDKVRCLSLTTIWSVLFGHDAVVEVSAIPVERVKDATPTIDQGRASGLEPSLAVRSESEEIPPRRPEAELATEPALQFVEDADMVVDGEAAKYTGQLNAAGQRHGKGCLVWADPNGSFYPKALSKNSFYEGEFVEDFRKGKGIFYVQEEGRLYEGIFERGVLFGEGKLTDVNRGLLYTGGFRKGMSSGEGRCEYQQTGRTFVGTWKRGRPLSGQLLEVDGRIIQSGNGPWSIDLAVDMSRAGPNASSGPPQISRPNSGGFRNSMTTVAHRNTRTTPQSDPPQLEDRTSRAAPPESQPDSAQPRGGRSLSQGVELQRNASPGSILDDLAQFQGAPPQSKPPSYSVGPSLLPQSGEPQPPVPATRLPGYVDSRDCVVEDEVARYTGPLNSLGQRHGHGFMIWADEEGKFYPKGEKKNTYYEGEFVEDSRSGNGVMFVKDENRIYQGIFDRGVLTGEGSLRDARRDLVYEGSFKKGTPHGEGKAVFGLSNRVFIGRWRKGQPVSGKLYNNQGQLLQQGSTGWGVELAID